MNPPSAALKPAPTSTIRHESLRIAGRKVAGEVDGVVEVFNPYTNEVVGTVPRASARQVREAFEIGARFKSKLSRYDRQRICQKTAELIAGRKDEIARLITAESGLCMKDSLYECGRAYDVWSLSGQLAILDDSQTFSCDVTPQGKPRRIHTMRQPLQGVISAITPFNHPLNMISHKIAPAVATNNRSRPS